MHNGNIGVGSQREDYAVLVVAPSNAKPVWAKSTRPEAQ